MHRAPQNCQYPDQKISLLDLCSLTAVERLITPADVLSMKIHCLPLKPHQSWCKAWGTNNSSGGKEMVAFREWWHGHRKELLCVMLCVFSFFLCKYFGLWYHILVFCLCWFILMYCCVGIKRKVLCWLKYVDGEMQSFGKGVFEIFDAPLLEYNDSYSTLKRFGLGKIF